MKKSSVTEVKSSNLVGWQPIETAPKSRNAIIVHCPSNKCSYMATWDDITNKWRHFGGSSYEIEREISHWMPAPEPPND